LKNGDQWCLCAMRWSNQACGYWNSTEPGRF
jgi:uncharacterized protein (DUF2237 family)